MKGKTANLRHAPEDRGGSLLFPGKVIRFELMEPNDLTAAQVAKGSGLAPQAISEILNGDRAITASTAKSLANFFGLSPMFFLNLQSQYELRKLEDLDITLEEDASDPPLPEVS